MKTFLMYKNRDFDPKQILSQRDRKRSWASNNLNLDRILPWNERDLTQDLGLDILFKTMSGGDEFLYEVAKVALLSSVTDIDTIRYRQYVFSDCLKNTQIIKNIYQIATDAIMSEETNTSWFFTKHPSSILYQSVGVLEIFVDMLRRLRAVVDQSTDEFKSEGFLRLFTMLQKELTDEYFALVEEHLRYLKFREGVLISAELGKGSKGTNYMLRKSPEDVRGWLTRLIMKNRKGYTYQIHPRDDIGARTLSELNDAGLNLVANATAQSVDHILGFFQMLRTELAFYIGYLNLYAKVAELGERTCVPVPMVAGSRRLMFSGLYDLSLALNMGRKVVGNDLNADSKNLFVITGANTGGKSTFLRSIGIAYLMMQAGMFVPADSFSAGVCESVFTHYKREEDRWMESGKWDEELGRMSEIIDHLKPNSLLLFNESFASTNEREGSEIADQVVKALLEERVKVFFVTHLYSLAKSFLDQKLDHAVFLRAERLPDGTRPFKLIKAEPKQTSYGEDLYSKIFSDSRI